MVLLEVVIYFRPVVFAQSQISTSHMGGGKEKKKTIKEREGTTTNHRNVAFLKVIRMCLRI